MTVSALRDPGPWSDRDPPRHAGQVSERTTSVRRPPPWRRWTLACGAGETIGMAAAAGTAGLLLAVVGEPHDWPSGLVVWVGSIAGGAVEGLAIGLLQFWVLHPWLPRLRRRRWVGVTVVVALAGWALGMAAPSLLTWRLNSAEGPAGTDAAAAGGPPLWLMPLAGAALGLAFGAVFGAAQASVLRGQVARPRRWVTANSLGWSAALAVMMTGASLPSGPWPLPQLLLLGGATGVLAGLAIGAVTGLFLRSLDDTAPPGGTAVNRVVLWLLRSPAQRALSGALVDLRYTGFHSGHRYALPVQYAEDGDRLVVVPGHPQTKVWWRSLLEPAPVEVTLRGRVRTGTGRVLRSSDRGYVAARTAYLGRWSRVRVQSDDPLVVLDLEDDSPVADGPHQPRPRRDPEDVPFAEHLEDDRLARLRA